MGATCVHAVSRMGRARLIQSRPIRSIDRGGLLREVDLFDSAVWEYYHCSPELPPETREAGTSGGGPVAQWDCCERSGG